MELILNFMRPVLSKSVYKILKRLLLKFKSPESKPLGEEIAKARIVRDGALGKNIVSLGSIVEYMVDSINRPIRMQIVLPDQADLSKRRISVLAPISVALLGFRESDHFQWEMPSGIKTLRILKVSNS